MNGLFEACRNYVGLLARTQVESWLRAKVDASDLVQQTLLEAYRDFGRFQGTTEAEWLAWLRRMLAHNAADFVRQYRGTKKRQPRAKYLCHQAPILVRQKGLANRRRKAKAPANRCCAASVSSFLPKPSLAWTPIIGR